MSTRLRVLLLVVLMTALLISNTPLIRAQGKDVTFFSTQFNIVEETAKAKTILADFKDGNVKFVPSEEGPMIDTLKAEGKAGKGGK